MITCAIVSEMIYIYRYLLTGMSGGGGFFRDDRPLVRFRVEDVGFLTNIDSQLKFLGNFYTERVHRFYLLLCSFYF